MNQVRHQSRSAKRAMSVRRKLHGTSKRPRLSVYRSNKHIYLQLIDDDKEVTLLSAADQGKKKNYRGTKTEIAQKIAKELAKEMKKKKINQIVFDRGPYRYHGRIKVVAETLRDEGIEF